MKKFILSVIAGSFLFSAPSFAYFNVQAVCETVDKEYQVTVHFIAGCFGGPSKTSATVTRRDGKTTAYYDVTKVGKTGRQCDGRRMIATHYTEFLDKDTNGDLFALTGPRFVGDTPSISVKFNEGRFKKTLNSDLQCTTFDSFAFPMNQ